MKKAQTHFRAWAQRALTFLLITIVVFVFVEGLGSAALAIRAVFRGGSSQPTRIYDELLGWAGAPNVYIPDAWGPGIYLRTNARGFRSDTETELTVPDGMHRIVCSGDSFTYGEGVANDRSWCHLLAQMATEQVESVNLGEPGYGVDQMFLRYSRDGIPLDHAIHIMAFVGGDLGRMARPAHYTSGKPILRVHDGQLVPDNVPVPRFHWQVSRVLARADLRSLGLGRRILGRIFPPDTDETITTDSIGPVASMVFKTVHRMTAEKKVLTLFVFLPTTLDLEADTPWRTWTQAVMDTLGLPFIDLTPELRNVAAGTAARFFIPQWMPAGGHYTERGNEWVAQTLYNRMAKIPALGRFLVGDSVAHREDAVRFSAVTPIEKS